MAIIDLARRANAPASVLLSVILLSVAGCASTPRSTFEPLNQKSRELLEQAELAIEVAEGKGLAHFTSAEQATMTTGMMFGAIGGALGAMAATSSANARGGKMATENGIGDPSLRVAERIRERLAIPAEASEGAGVRLVLKTTHWAVRQEDLAYFVRLDLLDAGARKIGGGECKYFRKAEEVDAFGNALFVDGSARLKSAYADAADHCAGYFVDNLLPQGRTLSAATAPPGHEPAEL